MRYLGPIVLMLAAVAILAADSFGIQVFDATWPSGGLYLVGALWWVVVATRPGAWPPGWAHARLWAPLAIPVFAMGAEIAAVQGNDTAVLGVLAYLAAAAPLLLMGLCGSIVLVGRRADLRDPARRRFSPGEQA